MYTKADIIRRLSELPKDKLIEFLRTYEREQKKVKPGEAHKDGLVFDICSIPPEVLSEMKMLEKCRDSDSQLTHNKKWLETIKSLPTKTAPLPTLDSDFLEYAGYIWSARVSGLEDIYNKLLLHIVQYLRTGKTRPIILLGHPGCGKTKVMLTLSEILGMPVHFANAVQVAKGNGLSGSSKTYVSAAPGEPVEAMVRHKQGNLILAIDEIDKAVKYSGHGGDFQDELLNITSDESSKYHKDNFLGFAVDASHLFIVMTANDLDSISAPLVSRCDVISFPQVSKETITDVLQKHTIPTLLSNLRCSESVFVNNDDVIEFVSKLFSSGVCDIRKYQGLVEEIINAAFLKSLEMASDVHITPEAFMDTADRYISTATTQRSIGFVA